MYLLMFVLDRLQAGKDCGDNKSRAWSLENSVFFFFFLSKFDKFRQVEHGETVRP